MNSFKKAIVKFQNSILFISRKKYFKKIQKGITDEELFLVSSDCVSGVIYHQLGRKFCSPFINLYIPIKEYFILINDFKNFMSSELYEDKESPNPFPVGYLTNKNGDKVHIKFMHYKTFTEAKCKWEERLKRFNFNKYFCILNCSTLKDREVAEEHLENFKKVTAPRKMFFSIFDFDCEYAYQFKFNNKKKIIIDPINRLVPYKKIIDTIDYSNVFGK